VWQRGGHDVLGMPEGSIIRETGLRQMKECEGEGVEILGP
jgi:hypothetical protein